MFVFLSNNIHWNKKSAKHKEKTYIQLGLCPEPGGINTEKPVYHRICGCCGTAPYSAHKDNIGPVRVVEIQSRNVHAERGVVNAAYPVVVIIGRESCFHEKAEVCPEY